MGWTKHREAILVFRSLRTETLANLRKLLKGVGPDLPLSEQGRIKLQLHKSLTDLHRLDVALGETSNYGEFVEKLLPLVHAWVFKREVHEEIRESNRMGG